MKRALLLVEGQTEERFAKDLLRPRFWEIGLDIAPTLLVTKQVKSGASFRGGITSFAKFERDAKRLLASASGALVTTMIDYQGLPSGFPGMDTRPPASPLERVRYVERAILEYFGAPPEFLPFLTLHEFEALLFSSPKELPRVLAQPHLTNDFASVRAQFGTPEDINERPGQSPSKRIENLCSTYRKTLHGPSAAVRIGLERIRTECPHFEEWLTRMEAFAAG